MVAHVNSRPDEQYQFSKVANLGPPIHQSKLSNENCNILQRLTISKFCRNGSIGFKPVFNILKKSWQHIRKTTDKRRNAARQKVDFIGKSLQITIHMSIAEIGQAVLELLKLQGITKGESPCIRNLKMTSQLRSHNFQILKIEIFSQAIQDIKTGFI